MTSALNRLENGNLELTINIPWKRIKTSSQQILEKLAKETVLKGFRQGKAPIELVEKQIGKEKLYQETLKKSYLKSTLKQLKSIN